MKKFLVLYQTPVSVIEEWMKTDPAIRKDAEEKMRGDWQKWMQAHGSAVVDMAGAGKTKRVKPEGTADIRNDVMLYSVVQAEDHATAAKMFESHPHLGIPQATIDVMEINPMSGMS